MILKLDPMAWAVVTDKGLLQETYRSKQAAEADIPYWDTQAGWEEAAPHKVVALVPVELP